MQGFVQTSLTMNIPDLCFFVLRLQKEIYILWCMKGPVCYQSHWELATLDSNMLPKPLRTCYTWK